MTENHGRRTGLSAAAMFAALGMLGLQGGSTPSNNIELRNITGATETPDAKPTPQQPGRTVRSLGLSSAGLLGGGGWGGGWKKPRYPNGPGWTFAHVKRMARKQKNRTAHRARVRANGGMAHAS